jgi:aspartyl aminopeptidase
VLLQLIAKEANCEPDDISDFELQLCDTQPSIVAGAMKEFIYSGRLDNLCMSFCSLKVCLTISFYLYLFCGWLFETSKDAFMGENGDP